MSRGLRLDCSLQDRLPGFDHVVELRFDGGRHVWNHLAHCPPQVFLHQDAIERGKPLVDPDVS